jgi:hypothetical protein
VPDRPVPPSLPVTLNDILARERALERRTLALLAEQGGIPLQTFEDGQPLGDTRFLNFGAGVRATLTGDGFVTVTGDAGGQGGWDAIVDSSLSASAPADRLFLGIGEALSALATLGLTRALVLVRPGAYTEAANFTTPQDVFLFGAVASSEGATATTWALAGFGGSGWNALRIHHIAVSSGTKSGPFFGQSAVSAASPSSFWGHAVRLTNDNAAALVIARFRCQITFGRFDGTGMLQYCGESGAFAYCDNCQQLVQGSSFSAMGSTTSQLYLTNYLFSVASSLTMTLPANAMVHGFCQSNGWGWGNVASGALTLTGTGRYDVEMAEASNEGRIALSFASATQVRARGVFAAVTIGAPGTGLTNDFRGRPDTFDITGPALLDIARTTSLVTIRGFSVNGHVNTERDGAIAVDFVGADHCHIAATGGKAAWGAGSKPYAFDAASGLNILDFAGASTYPVAGTDAGAGNLIRVT